MSTDTRPLAPPTTSRLAAANLVRMQTAGRKIISTFVEKYLHLVDDDALKSLHYDVVVEVRERERTRARTSGDEAGGTT